MDYANNIATVIVTPYDLFMADCKKDLSFKVNTDTEKLIYKSKLLFDTTEVLKLDNALVAIKTPTNVIIATDKYKIYLVDGEYCFEDRKFTSIDMTNVDTSLCNKGLRMFSRLRFIKKINLSTMDTSNMEVMEGMFREIRLDTLDLSSFNTSKVTNMEYMFEDSSIKHLNISSFDTTKTLQLFQMFKNFTTDELDIRHFKTCKNTNMTEMLADLTTKRLLISELHTNNICGIIQHPQKINNFNEIKHVFYHEGIISIRKED